MFSKEILRMTGDFFRPRVEPARTIYDAFQDEAKHRVGRTIDEWIQAERIRVWKVSRDYAQQNGLRVPTIGEIEKAEQHAMGHIDYAAKWAYYVADLIVDG